MATSLRPPPTVARIGSPLSFNLPRIKVAASSLLTRNDSRYADLRLQNSNRPACALPERVLRDIFEFCAASTVGRPDSELTLSSSPSRGRSNCVGAGGLSTWSWVLLTYVCHSWRHTALGFPELWRYVDFSHPRWSAITLARAKIQPLCVNAVVSRHNLAQLHRTLQYAHRIASVRLDSGLHHIHGLLDTLVHPNPSLEEMTIRVNTAGHGVEGQVYPLPAYPLVGPDLPAMRYLELQSAPFYLVSERYVSLKELHIYDLTPCERPTLRQFMSTLSAFTEIEHLTLDHAFPLATNTVPFPDDHMSVSPTGSPKHSPSSSPRSSPASSPAPNSPSKRTSLPHLACLRLVGTLTELTTILDNITLPSHTSISLQITTLSDWQQSLPKLAQALAVHTWAAAAGGCPTEMLVLSGIEEDAYPPAMKGLVYGGAHTSGISPLVAKGLRIRGFSSSFDSPSASSPLSPLSRSRSPMRAAQSAPPPKPTVARSVPSLDITLGPDADPDFSTDAVMVHALSALWKALALANAHTLVLHDLDYVTQKTWTQLLRGLPALKVLDVTGHAPCGFVWALLLNAVSCIQREEMERERKEKRERKMAAVSARAASPMPPMSCSPDLKTFPTSNASTSTTTPPLSPIPPTSPLTPAPSSSRMLFVPRLTDVYLHGVDCSAGGYMVAQNAPVNSPWDLDDSRFLDVLLACLQMRAQADALLTSSLASEAASRPSTPLPGGLTHTRPSSTSRLRSVSLANCRSVPRHALLLLNQFVLHPVWDQRGMVREKDDNGLARYRVVGNAYNVDVCPSVKGKDAALVDPMAVHGYGKEGVRHYFRLKTLLDELEES